MNEPKVYKLPAEDVNDESAVITSINFEPNTPVKVGDIIYSFETTKAIIDVGAEHDGYIYYLVKKGEEVYVGDPVCEITKNEKKNLEADVSTKINSKLKILPTKKAVEIINKYKIDIESTGLTGVVKEADLEPFIIKGKKVQDIDHCKTIDKNNSFIKELLFEKRFKTLSSEEKVKRYITEGHTIGENVILGDNVVLIANKITIGSNVTVGNNTYIESAELAIGDFTSIGESCHFVASLIKIGSNNKIAKKVNIDLSGGRNPDSNFITGKGCLLSSEVQINVCHQVSIGDNVALSPRSMIYTHSYWQSILDGYKINFGKVHIKDNSWLGSSSQILPNVTVGTGAIIMSNSLVANNVKDFSLVGGVPAKVIKENLKKNYNKNQILNILHDQFNGLKHWFNMNSYNTVSINQNKFLFESNGQKRTITFHDDDHHHTNSEKVYNEDFDIILTYDSNLKTNNYNSLLVVKTEVVIGDLDYDVKVIIEYFRRKGIRFYASG